MNESGPTGDREVWQTPVMWVVALAGIVTIGLFDFASGTELRVYPLYYLPISLLAWHSQRAGAVVAALLCALTWLYFNRLAGMPVAGSQVWLANTIVNGVSFLFVGLLVNSLRRSQLAARDLSRTDALTSLRNSRAFFEDSTTLLALCRRAKRPVTLAYLDLDHFKAINDSLGHDAGDALLKAIADAMRETLRPSDVCARLGGDEFAILLPELGPGEVATTLERLHEKVRVATAGAAGVSASIGAVTYVTAPLEVSTLVQRADALMYDAKANGRNRISRVVVGATDAVASGE